MQIENKDIDHKIIAKHFGKSVEGMRKLKKKSLSGLWSVYVKAYNYDTAITINESRWLVVMPNCIEESLQIGLVDYHQLAESEELAWKKFLAPGLKREGYEADGFKAILVDVKISKSKE